MDVLALLALDERELLEDDGVKERCLSSGGACAVVRMKYAG